MARTKKTPFAPWESAKPNGIENRYIRLGNSLLCHPTVQGLNPLAFKILTYMKLESAGRVEFEFPHAKFIKIASKGGFQKAVKELVAAGLIEITEKNANLRIPNKYRFSDKWKTNITS